MPHSTSEELSTATKQEDVILPDAPEGDNDGGESSDPGDAPLLPSNSTKDPAKIDFKLEELFNDDDEDDEEFPSSGPPSGNMPSSPPAAPL